MPALKQEDLKEFTGDLKRFRHPFNRRVIYTPGVRHVAKEGEAYWLIDAIASWLGSHEYLAATANDDRLCDWMLWTLTVNENQSAKLEARADGPDEPWITQAIPFTDFPLRKIDIWAATDGGQWTLYLPSEH